MYGEFCLDFNVASLLRKGRATFGSLTSFFELPVLKRYDIAVNLAIIFSLPYFSPTDAKGKKNH